MPFSLSTIFISFIFFLSFCLLLIILTNKSRKRIIEPWRVKKSKQWIVNFRAGREIYSAAQRFSYIRKVDHFLWEEIIMTCFLERGYNIKRTKMTRDGGVDGFVEINGRLHIIQAKRYSGNILKSHVISFLNLIKSNVNYKRGIFIHTGKTSGPIISLFRQNHEIYLMSGVDTILDFIDGRDTYIFGEKISTIVK